MSRTARFLSGFGLGYINMVVMLLVGLVLTPFLLGRLGAHEYGLWILVNQLLNYLGLLDLGIVALLPRETAYATGRANGDVAAATELPELVGRTLRIVLWQTPVVLLACVAVFVALPHEWDSLSRPLGVILICFVVRFPLRVFPEILQGLQDLGFLGRMGLAFTIVNGVLSAALVAAGAGLYALVVMWALWQFGSTLICLARIRRRFPTVLPKRLPPVAWPEFRKSFTSGMWVSLSQIAQMLLFGTDILLVGKILGPEAVVVYSCTGKLVSVVANQPFLILEVARPALSELRYSEDRNRLVHAASALSQGVLLLSGAIVCGVLLLNHGFVSWWVGEKYFGGYPLTTALVASMLLRHLNSSVGTTIFCLGYERRLCVTAVADGIVSSGLAIPLIWLFGGVGAPVAALIGVGFVSLPANMVALARELGVSVARVFRGLAPWLVRFAGLALVVGMLGLVWTPRGFVTQLIAGLAVGSVYVVLMVSVARRPPLSVYLLPQIERIRLRFAGGAGDAKAL